MAIDKMESFNALMKIFISSPKGRILLKVGYERITHNLTFKAACIKAGTSFPTFNRYRKELGQNELVKRLLEEVLSS